MADETADTEGVDKNDNDNLKELRKLADEGRKASREAELARKELLFVKAGVDTDTKLGKLLLASYDGELSVDAIKAEAEELGAVASPSTPKPPALDPEERRQGRERQDLASESGSPASVPDESPQELALKAFSDARAAGARREDAAAAAFSQIFEAAQRGDERAIVR